MITFLIHEEYVICQDIRCHKLNVENKFKNVLLAHFLAESFLPFVKRRALHQNAQVHVWSHCKMIMGIYPQDIFTSCVSGRGYKNGPVHVCVSVC